ncbi:MAG: hypothetical protein HY453_02135 [Parcubacteria group bacterium]|nr:hypothetical protein [Parcubacteria group bacterium]
MSNIRSFSEISKSDVALVGGKGASLGEMTRVGIPVPSGFVIVASAFDEFLRETDLTQEISAQIAKVNYENIASVESASNGIRDLISDARFPESLQKEVMNAFTALDAEFVAVRSSATAEDSSMASWAGELETYLNTTDESLLMNVKKCWASLFTPRAIVYRNEKGMKDTHVSVAVVVQKMVQSEISGITFTVHPVTKDKNQMIIEAAFGLGEFIVGGHVTPDAYVIDKRDISLLDVNVSVQEHELRYRDGSNQKILVSPEKKFQQKLNGEQIQSLANLCLDIEHHYGFPCDIEWAYEKDRFYIVQSRPITTL